MEQQRANERLALHTEELKALEKELHDLKVSQIKGLQQHPLTLYYAARSAAKHGKAGCTDSLNAKRACLTSAVLRLHGIEMHCFPRRGAMEVGAPCSA